MSPVLGETVYLWFPITLATGAAGDADSLPTCAVYEDSTTTAIHTPTVVNASTGLYYVPVAASVGNGFESGKSYNVVITATVGGLVGKATIASFQVRGSSTDSLTTLIGAGVTVASGGITSSSFTAGAINAAAIATDAIGAAELAADAVTKIQTSIWTTTVPGSYTSGQAGNTLGNIATGSAPSAATVAAAVWNELKASHTTDGTYGFLLDAAISTLSTASALSTAAGNISTILGQTGTTGVVVASGSKSGYALSSSGLDTVVIETSLNARQSLSVITAAVLGIKTGFTPGSVSTGALVKNPSGSTTRATVSSDANGQPTSVTLSPPA